MVSEENTENQNNKPTGGAEKKSSGPVKRRRRPYREWKKKSPVTKDTKSSGEGTDKKEEPKSTPVAEKKTVQKKSYHNRRGTGNRRPKQRTTRFQDDSVFEGMVEIDFSNFFFQEQAKILSQFNGEIPAGMRQMKSPGIDTKIARERIVSAIKEAVLLSGKKMIYMGISGGVDSAVAAALAMAALGRDKVRFVHFIEMEKSAPTRARADLISRGLKNHLEMHDLRPRLQGVVNGSNLAEKKKKITRARTLALYELAEANQALVMGSMNKTKRLLGYGTRFGDLAYDLNPLEDVYFSQLIEMARVLNVPKVIREQSLVVEEAHRPKQNVDAVWKEIDYYLYQMVDMRFALSHLKKLGMAEEKLLWLYQCMRTAMIAGNPAPEVSMSEATIPSAVGF